MRKFGFCFLILFTLGLLTVPLAEAQLSGEFAEWGDGPEGFLLTKKERKEWAKISTDAEAEHFVELFWARRNPEADNPFNTFKAEFEAKVRYADETFAYKNHRGALSDRGKVLILMGRPVNVQKRVAGQSGSGQGGTGSARGNSEFWIFDPLALPKGFKVKGTRLVFTFVEEILESNGFVLDRSDRESFPGVSALAGAPEVYLLHPDLQEVPKPVSIAGGKPASSMSLAWLRETDAPLNEEAVLLAELGVTDMNNRAFWIHLELPEDAPVLDLLVGRVTSDEGEVLSTFEIQPKPIAAYVGKAYHLSFSLAPGKYTLQIAGGAVGTLQYVDELSVDITPIPEEGSWLSPIWLGTSAEMDKEALPGAPFTFGGWRLTPVSGPELSRKDEITYFGFLVRPGIDEAGAIKLRARVKFKLDGKPVFKPILIPLETAKLYEDLYMFGSSIPLSGLPEPGLYEISFKISDGISKVATERVLAFELAQE